MDYRDYMRVLAAWNLKRLALKITTTFQGLLLKTWLCPMQGLRELECGWGSLTLCQPREEHQREASVPNGVYGLEEGVVCTSVCNTVFRRSTVLGSRQKTPLPFSLCFAELTLFLLLQGSSIQSTKGLSQPTPQQPPASRPSGEYTKPLDSRLNGPKPTSRTCVGLFP